MTPLTLDAAIVGVGYTEFSRYAGRTELQLACEAIVACAKKHPNVIVRCSSEFPFFPAAQKIARMIEQDAFGTILDSNVTTFIVGVMLLAFGSGPVRGFAIVHCLGILTSIFSSVVVSRSIVNLTYGSRRRLERVAIGNTSWK